MNASRRQFVHGVGILGALFLGRSLIACAAPPNGEATGETNDSLALTACGDAVIGHNHGHALQVPAEDVAAGAEKTYSIKGAAGHDHLVTLTAEHFGALTAGGSITVTSTTMVGHAHPVTVTCAAAPNATDAGPAVCPNGATASAISANHGHTLIVPTADVTAAVAKTYSIKGTASHDHAVALTPDHFAQLAAGAAISVTSTTTGAHAHVVKVICA